METVAVDEQKGARDERWLTPGSTVAGLALLFAAAGSAAWMLLSLAALTIRRS